MLDTATLYAVGIALVIIGVALIVAVLIRSAVRVGTSESRVQGAGVIMIGPIPIISGTDKKSVKAVLALALALSIVILLIYLIYYGLLRV